MVKSESDSAIAACPLYPRTQTFAVRAAIYDCGGLQVHDYVKARPPGSCLPKASLESSVTISREKLGLLLGIVGICLFAGTLPATRLAVIGFDPLFLTVARAALAGLAGLIVVLITARRLPPWSLWLELFGAAFCSVLCFPLFAAVAMMTLPATHGGIVQGILPLATAAAAAIFAHERPSAGFWLASTAGAIVVLAFVSRQNGNFRLSTGDLFLFGTVCLS